MSRHPMPSRGFTLIELVVTLTLVSVLALVVVPMYDMTIRHKKESELRDSLRTIREALDAYKSASDSGYISRGTADSGYPPDLQTLVDGVDTIQQIAGTNAPNGASPAGVNLAGSLPGLPPGSVAPGAAAGANGANGNGATAPSIPPHMVFLRRVPRDPFYPDQSEEPQKQWNIRAYANAPDDYTEGSDVYDVASKSKDVGLNGIPYKDW